MPIQITQHILNLKEEKFAAPWAITIDKIIFVYKCIEGCVSKFFPFILMYPLLLLHTKKNKRQKIVQEYIS